MSYQPPLFSLLYGISLKRPFHEVHSEPYIWTLGHGGVSANFYRETKHTREKSPARLSPQLPRRREPKQHLFLVDSLDKHMQNEKELIRLRCFMPAARTTRTRSEERAISPAARTTLHQGGSNFSCGANYPHQALKRGYFVFVWRVRT